MPVKRFVVGRLLIGAVVALGAVSVATATAQADTGPTVISTGSALVKPVPLNPHDDASIGHAVQVAEAKALPLAMASAQTHAAALAGAAGGTLGALLSISDAPALGYPVFIGLGPQVGPFGIGRYCVQVSDYKIVKTSTGARRRVPLKGTHKVCRVPPQVGSSVTLTYLLVLPPA